MPALDEPQQTSIRTSEQKQGERTYVLDTSVLLSDPKAIFRFAEHAVVLPVVVVSELEAKRNDPEIGFFARQALRNLDELRVQHERLDFPIAVGDGGGSLRVELNHSNMTVLPSGLQLGDNDSRILAVALNLSNDGLDVVVVSKDLPLRVKAASIGLAALRSTAPSSRSTPAGPAWPRSTSPVSRWPSCTTTRPCRPGWCRICRSTPVSSSTRSAVRPWAAYRQGAVQGGAR